MTSLKDLPSLLDRHKLQSLDEEKEVVKRISVSSGKPTYREVFAEFIWRNRPFLLSGDACCNADGTQWEIFRRWLHHPHGSNKPMINTEYLVEKYGDDVVPVAQCSKCQFDDHPKLEMTLREYLSNKINSADSLYVKDYHFTRWHDDEIYQCPVYFTSDWLNEYCIDKGLDDYKFVYLGSKGTWTPFHADVLRTYSWSANITGQKLWIIYPPGKEELLKNKYGQLPFDVSVEPYTNTDHPSYEFRQEIIQNEGEIIFIPSGWHHQVHNLDVTLSVNHNWFNGCNIHRCWQYLQETLLRVEKEISDCEDMDDWHEHCQVLLKAYLGFDYEYFYKILFHVAYKRLETDSIPPSHDDQRTFDLNSIQYVCELMIDDPKVQLFKTLYSRVQQLKKHVTYHKENN